MLPSSIHEWLTISANTTMGYDEISEMVHSVNADVVEPEEYCLIIFIFITGKIKRFI